MPSNFSFFFHSFLSYISYYSILAILFLSSYSSIPLLVITGVTSSLSATFSLPAPSSWALSSSVDSCPLASIVAFRAESPLSYLPLPRMAANAPKNDLFQPKLRCLDSPIHRSSLGKGGYSWPAFIRLCRGSSNVSLEKLASDTGYGLRGMQFSNLFPNLKRLLVRNRHFNLNGVILSNG